MTRPRQITRSSLILPIVYGLANYATLSLAFDWSFQDNPKQCGNLTINISGSGGKPPYRVLILPFGPTTLPNNVEARRIVDVPFDGTSTSVSFQLKYPENTQFVAVVSDSSRFGSGGTSVPVKVSPSSDASCFDASQSVSPLFFFNIEPSNQIVQCVNTRIWWDPATAQGNTNFLGVIPGGQSFSIPQSSLTPVSGQGTGFNWRPNLRAGTTLFIVGGDSRGNGTAGSSLNLVAAGINPDSSCLDDSSPSSTPGSPAGGSYPTGSTSPGGGSGGGSSNTGAIVGGVIGGLVLLAGIIIALFFYRRRSRKRTRIEKPVDLGDDDEDGEEHGDRQNNLPQFYQPEPFTVPDPTIASTYGDGQTEDGTRPLSGTSTSFYTRSTTPDGSAALGYGGAVGGAASSVGGTSRKGAPPRVMRPVNIIQHDDAGPSLPPPKDDEDPETIELPPAYTALKDIPSRTN